MYVKNLKIGDKFTHHEFGQTEITDYAERAVLCKSESCPSFMVDEDYVAIDPVFSKPSVDEIAGLVNNMTDEEKLDFLSKVKECEIDTQGRSVKCVPTVDEIAEIIRNYSYEEMEKLVLEIYSIRYSDNLPPFIIEVQQIQLEPADPNPPKSDVDEPVKRPEDFANYEEYKNYLIRNGLQ